MKRKCLYFGLLLFVLNFLTSCGSTPKFSGKGDFCILVIDENNQPVNQVVLSCYKNGVEMGTGISNENGLILIENFSGGKYEIKGLKSGYGIGEKMPVNFSSRNDVFCFQIRSGDSVLDEVEKYYENGGYEEGLECLNNLYFEKKDYVYALICYYKAYGLMKLGRKKEAVGEIKKIEHVKQFHVDLTKLKKVLEEN